MTKKDWLFARLAAFLRRNAELVADARDTNSPWTLKEQLQRFEDKQRAKRKRRKT